MENPKPYDWSSLEWMLEASNLENRLEEDAVLGLMNLKHDKTQILSENLLTNDSSETVDDSSSATLSGSPISSDMTAWTQNEPDEICTWNSGHVNEQSTNSIQHSHTEIAYSSRNDHRSRKNKVQPSTIRRETHSDPGTSQVTPFQPNTADTTETSTEDPEPRKGPNRKTIKAKKLESLIENTGIPNPNGTCDACRRRNKTCKVLNAQRTLVCALCSKLKQKCKFEY